MLNENIGLGQNMALIVSAAVADPVIVFRPQAWGFFVGPDFGMGWCWGVYVFGLIATFHLLFMEIAGGRPALSLVAAIALLFSPYFQFWSLGSAVVASSVALGVVAAHRLVFATQRFEKWLCGIGLGWSAGVFALTLYLPFQVVMGYFGLFTLLGLILRSLKRGRSIRWDGDRTLACLAALLIPGFAVLHLFQIASDAITLTQNTLYPGQRVASGGTSTLWRIFSNNVYPHFFVRASPAFGGNICEGASFILFFPLILFVLVQKKNRSAFAADPLLCSLLAFIAILLGWNLLGYPDAVARFSLLSKVPEYRAVIGFGVADMALVVAWFGAPAADGLRLRSTARRAAFFAAMLAPLLLLFLAVGRQDPQFFGSGALLQIALLVSAQLAIGFLLARKRPAALLVFAALNVLSTAWFNPVVHGGFDQIWNNPVSAKIRDLDAARGGHSSWIVFDDLVDRTAPSRAGSPLARERAVPPAGAVLERARPAASPGVRLQSLRARRLPYARRPSADPHAFPERGCLYHRRPPGRSPAARVGVRLRDPGRRPAGRFEAEPALPPHRGCGRLPLLRADRELKPRAEPSPGARRGGRCCE